MRVTLATLAGRAAGTASRLTGRGATSLPGLVGLKVDPSLIEKRARRLAGSVVVTGTNGKTTTSRFIGSLLTADGRPLIHNQSGSNLLRGLAASLLHHRIKPGTWGLFEVDEATMPEACRRLQPSVVVVTNLFRDQLDRYGELKRSADYLRTGLQLLPKETTIILNADDPLVASLAKGLPQRVLFYGIEDTKIGGTELPHAADSLSTATGELLKYTRVYVGHLGHYAAKGVKRPKPDVAATSIKLEGLASTAFKLTSPTGTQNISLGLPGLYNVYNALAAAGVASALSIPASTLATALSETAAAFGRLETVDVDGKKVFIGLIKNPTGANELLSTITLAGGPKHYLIMINDNFADGRDVSWLWDADFERILPDAAPITVGGTRAADIALRLKYAGYPIDQLHVASTVAKALEHALATVPTGETLYALPTYTAMLELRQTLSRAGHISHFLQ